MNIGWIGLGNIGGPAALHLVEGGHSVKVHDIRREAAASHLAKGAKWANSPAEASEGCDAVFTSLPFPPDVEAVVYGPKGLKETLSPGSVYGDLTTNKLSLTKRMFRELGEEGVAVLDMPISGGHRGSVAGTMAIWVGGDEAVFNRMLPVLQIMGNPLYCGPSGSGTIIKLVNNLITTSIPEIIVEGLTIGIKADVPMEVMMKALPMGLLGKSPLQGLSFVDEYQTGSRLELGAASLRFACELARELDVPADLANVVEQRHIEALAKGWAKRAAEEMYKVFESHSGVKLRWS